MNDTFKAPALRNMANAKEFASSHYATLKAAWRHGGAEVPGYEPLCSYRAKHHSESDTFVRNSGWGRDLSLNMMKSGSAGSPELRGQFLRVDARVKHGIWKKEMISVCNVAGESSLITRVVMPRPWSTEQLQIHQVNLPSDATIPPTYSKRVGPDFALQESNPGQPDYPRQQVWAMFDAAKEMDQMLRIPGRTLDSLAADFDQALGGVRPPYWDGETKV